MRRSTSRCFATTSPWTNASTTARCSRTERKSSPRGRTRPRRRSLRCWRRCFFCAFYVVFLLWCFLCQTLWPCFYACPAWWSMLCTLECRLFIQPLKVWEHFEVCSHALTERVTMHRATNRGHSHGYGRGCLHRIQGPLIWFQVGTEKPDSKFGFKLGPKSPIQSLVSSWDRKARDLWPSSRACCKSTPANNKLGVVHTGLRVTFLFWSQLLMSRRHFPVISFFFFLLLQVMGLMIAPLDKFRDLFREFPTQT